jgi:hypothetical protein
MGAWPPQASSGTGAAQLPGLLRLQEDVDRVEVPLS